MKITKEVREYVIWNFGNDARPQEAADYLHNSLCEDWPDMSKLVNSKLHQDLLEAFRWWDERFGGKSGTRYLMAIHEHGWKWLVD